MGLLIEVILKIIILKGKGIIPGQTVDYTKVSGNKIKCMGEAFLHGLTAENIPENTSTTKRKATENSFGQTVVATVENGRTESSTGKARILLLLVRKSLANGLKEKGLGG